MGGAPHAYRCPRAPGGQEGGAAFESRVGMIQCLHVAQQAHADVSACELVRRTAGAYHALVGRGTADLQIIRVANPLTGWNMGPSRLEALSCTCLVSLIAVTLPNPAILQGWSTHVFQFNDSPSDGPGALRVTFREELADQFIYPA
jgi:hypothetical protein